MLRPLRKKEEAFWYPPVVPVVAEVEVSAERLRPVALISLTRLKAVAGGTGPMSVASFAAQTLADPSTAMELGTLRPAAPTAVGNQKPPCS